MKNRWIAVALSIGAVGLLASREPPAAATTSPAAASAAAAVPAPNFAPVRVEPAASSARPEPAAEVADMARGVIRPVHEATLSSRASARIIAIPLAEGMRFQKGDLLIDFDCERSQAEARAADSAVLVQTKTVETNVELDQFNAIGKNDLLISKAQLAKVIAEAEAMKSQLRDCKLFAPFSGRIVERLAHAHETVSGSQPLLKIVDTEALELDLIVPSAWLQWLAVGSKLQFVIDETGQKVSASVSRLPPTVDPVSKTTRLIGRFEGRPAGKPMLPGMSGTAQFANAGRS
jgi:membrane fusion protein, multidrug efflux system